MNVSHLCARTPLLAACLLAFACDSGAKKEDAAKKDEKKTEAKEEKAKDEKPKKAKPSNVRADGTPKKYRRGQRAPEGMDAQEMKNFAEDVGDPTLGNFTLENAFEGDPNLADKSKGKLTATLDTDKGSFECTLLEDEAPITVANFVGLARGTRPTWSKDKNEWVKVKLYDGVIFHRVMAGFMVQTGDGSTAGHGNNPGYVIPDEFGEKHGKAGALSMANREKPGTGATQFFVTVKPTPHLDGKHSVFGRCDPKVAIEISKVKVNKSRNNRPYEQVKLNSVTISRK